MQIESKQPGNAGAGYGVHQALSSAQLAGGLSCVPGGGRFPATTGLCQLGCAPDERSIMLPTSVRRRVWKQHYRCYFTGRPLGLHGSSVERLGVVFSRIKRV